MDVGILGPLVVRQNDRPVTISAAKQRALLVLLVLHRGEVVPVDTLVELVWGGEAPATATKIVHGYVSQLRKVLGGGALETLPGGYLLRLSEAELDAARFEALLDRGRALLHDDPHAAATVLEQALQLWRGPVLVEFRRDDFASSDIRRLEELRVLALELRLQADLTLGRHTEAVPALEQLVREHPLRENACRLLMLALYRSGRQADALAAYHSARRVLVDELGVEPGVALQRMETAILRHDPALEQIVAATPEELGESRGEASPRDRMLRRRTKLVATAAALLLAAGVVVGVLVTDHPASRHATLPVDSVGFIDASADGFSGQVPLGGRPTAIAVSTDAVWVVDTAANSVARIDPSTRRVVQTVPVGAGPAGIAVGGGSVWVADHDEDTVDRINPASNSVVQRTPVGAGPAAIAYGFGAVWVTNSDDRTLDRIDSATGIVVRTIRTNAVGRGVAVGPNSVWVTDEAADRVVEVDPDSNAVVAANAVGSGPSAIAYGAGSLWVVNEIDGTVSRLDPDTLASRTTITVPGGPSAIAVDADAVWVGEEFAGRVVRIDAVRSVITSTTAIGSRPQGLATSGSGVWVAAQPTGAGHRGGRLVMAGEAFASIDPAADNLVPELTGPAYDALTALRRVGGGAGSQIVPDLAAALPQPTDAGRTYTFRLRAGIHYSNGAVVQAADFRRALERIVVAGGLSQASYASVVGVSACGGHPTCDLSAGVVVTDPSTVVFHLTVPDHNLFEELQHLTPVPAGTPDHDVGSVPVPSTGPYAIQTFVRGRLLTFVRNRHFRVWSEAARPDGYPDEIDYEVVGNDADALHQVAAGRADLADLFTRPAALAQFAAQHPNQVHDIAQQSVVFVFLNVRRPPFDNRDARQALNYAVDRGAAAAKGGAARPTCQIVPPTVTGYVPYCPYTVDPNPQGRWSAPDLPTARRLVAASGTQGEQVVLWTIPDFAAEASIVVEALEELGYRASLHAVPVDEYFDVGIPPTVQAGMYGWFGSQRASDAFETLTCGFDPNPAHFCDPKLDREIAQLVRTEPTDPGGTLALAASIDRALTSSAPWVPLLNPESVAVASPRVGNYQAQSEGVLLDQLWVN